MSCCSFSGKGSDSGGGHCIGTTGTTDKGGTASEADDAADGRGDGALSCSEEDSASARRSLAS